MGTILKKAYDGYYYLNYEVIDEKTKNYPTLQSPFIMMGVLVFYNYFVRKLGPKLMENRKPFNLRKTLLVYNAFQVIASAYFTIRAFSEVYRIGGGGLYSWTCQPPEDDKIPLEKQYEIREHIYFYYMLKLLDLLDTVFFVLRKKYNQISFLHLYHHTGMVMLSWSCTKWMPEGHHAMVGSLNSLVHACMYFYYFMSALYPESSRNWLKWKKLITQIQMAQFAYLIYHFLLLFVQPNCSYPLWPAFLMIPQNAFMLFLFYDFYRQAYMRKPKVKTELNGTNGTNGAHSNGKSVHKTE